MRKRAHGTELEMRKPLLLLSILPALYAVTVDPSIISKIEESWRLAKAAFSSSPDEAEGAVEYGLEGEGYHRDLVVTLNWQQGGEGDGGIDWIIALNVTSQFYIDLDQISQMAAFGGPDVISSGHINTELHAADSESHVVLVYTSLHDSEETVVKVPLHLCYQATGSTPYSATIIPTPHLLLRVSEGGAVSLPCSPTSPSSLCHWRHPSLLTPSHPTQLVAMVPIGQNNHLIPVVVVTITLTFGSMLYLVHTISHLTNKDKNL